MGVSHECSTRSTLINRGYSPISQGKLSPEGDVCGNLTPVATDQVRRVKPPLGQGEKE